MVQKREACCVQSSTGLRTMGLPMPHAQGQGPRGQDPCRPAPSSTPRGPFSGLRSRFQKTWETFLYKDTAIHPNAMKHQQNKGC